MLNAIRSHIRIISLRVAQASDNRHNNLGHEALLRRTDARFHAEIAGHMIGLYARTDGAGIALYPSLRKKYRLSVLRWFDAARKTADALIAIPPNL